MDILHNCIVRNLQITTFRIIKYFLFIILLGCYACENEKALSHDHDMSDKNMDISNTLDENMYTNADGDFLVDYDVEFLPYIDIELDQKVMEGVLRISALKRIEKDSAWKVAQSDCQLIDFPFENTLPLFLITDNLQVEDDKEGYMLNFYNHTGTLLRSISYSIEDWLLIIGEIRQSHYGYLPIDLGNRPKDILIMASDIN